MHAAVDTAFRDGVRRAIEHCGSQAELERQSGIAQQTLSWLLHKAPKISAEHAIALERATGGVVRRYELRPDLFDAPIQTEAAE